MSLSACLLALLLTDGWQYASSTVHYRALVRLHRGLHVCPWGDDGGETGETDFWDGEPGYEPCPTLLAVAALLDVDVPA